eukprot:4117854-Alexandrium_andersonii.AAC.1
MPLRRCPRAALCGRSTRARPPLADSKWLRGHPSSTTRAAPAQTTTQMLPPGYSWKASGPHCLLG